jgi:hypothetical protein
MSGMLIAPISFGVCLVFFGLPEFHAELDRYNSTIYATTAAVAYNVFAGPASLAEKSTPEVADMTSLVESSFQELYDAAKNGTLEHLDNNDCLDAFAQTYQTTYSNLWVVSNSTNDTYLLVYTNPVYDPAVIHMAGGTPGPYDWLCPSGLVGSNCDGQALSEVRSEIADNDWSVGDSSYQDERYNVQYCMAMRMPQYCKLQYSFPLTMVAIAFNLVKASILLYMWLGIPEAPILTIGDAIASFLRRPDSYTQSGCLFTGAEVRRMGRNASAPPNKELLHGPKLFENKRRRWAEAVSGGRWTFSVIL